MKRALVLVVLAIALAVPAFAEYPPKGWNADIKDAIAEAEADDKILILNFTGSDWCGWCMKLSEEVFDTREFKNWADDNAVRVFLDFPSGIDLPNETIQQNQLLQQYFRVRGYPTIMVLDSDLTPLLQTGYRAGGAGEYIRHIEEDRNLTVEEPQAFRDHFLGILDEYL